jgi:signal peptidase II
VYDRVPEQEPALRPMPNRRPLIAAGLIAAILDLVTKSLVFRHLGYMEERPVLGDLVSFRPVYNDAGPWSWGRGWEFLRFVLPAISVAAIAVIGRIFWTSDPRDRVRGLGLVLILGGAVGNLWDRALTALDKEYGGVRDFILVKGVWFGGDFPAFNLADAWITVGVVLVAWRILFELKTGTPAPVQGESRPVNA